MKKILFAGGDTRTLAAIEYMKRYGYAPITYGIENRNKAEFSEVEAVVFPFPTFRNGRLNAPLNPNPPTLEETITETGIDPNTVFAVGGPIKNNPFTRYTDLSENEELKLRNAVTTAEGAIALLIENTDRAVFGMPILTVGYGAIGKRLSQLLHAMGANVTVAARKEKDRTDALLHGCKTMDTAKLSLRGQKAILNTVPVQLITESISETADEDACFLELASSPGGCDPDDVKKRMRKWISGASLPGKVAPVTAGEDLAKTLIPIFSLQKRKGSGTTIGT